MEDQAPTDPPAQDFGLTPWRYADKDRKIPNRWTRTIQVVYVPAGEEWRPAAEGEKCRQGGGGHSGFRTTACGRPAIVTQVRQYGGANPRAYPWPLCGRHSGGRVPTPDGRVAEPVENPLGGI